MELKDAIGVQIKTDIILEQLVGLVVGAAARRHIVLVILFASCIATQLQVNRQSQ